MEVNMKIQEELVINETEFGKQNSIWMKKSAMYLKA